MSSKTAALPHPVEALRADHRRASRLIRLLTDQIEGLARLRPLDIEIAQGVFRYMVDFVDNQHHAREDFLIEILGKRNTKAQRKVLATNEDHDELKQEGKDILAILANQLARPDLNSTKLVKRLHHYADTLITHFKFEEAYLFSTAENVLDEKDWQKIERQSADSGDPLFGEEIEESYKALFDIYINQVREIGSPASRHRTVSAAAFVDTASALASGTKSFASIWWGGSLNVLKINLAGAKSLARSRSLSEYVGTSMEWSRSWYIEAKATSSQLRYTLENTAREVVEPLAEALGAQIREFEVSHRPDQIGPSWQSQLANLALRATVKRMASNQSGEDFEIPTANIEIPRTSIERFIPRLAGDVLVERMELDNAFAEVMSIKGNSATRTVLFFPGGGFMMAPTQAHRLMAARLARSAMARVILVHYRLAPEHRFPAGLDDCVEAYRYLVNSGTPAESMAIIGDSAGGGMALSALLRIRDEGMPLPAAGVLLSPVTDLSYSGLSRKENSWSDPSLTNDENNLMAEIYLGETSKNDPSASPLFADLSDLPPILIQVGSVEVLLDDALRVAAKIRSQGGECECEVWHDMPHDWMLFGMLPEARKALRRIVEFIDTRFADHVEVSAATVKG